MTNQQYYLDTMELLNRRDVSTLKRKKVEENLEYQIAKKQNNWKGAFEIVDGMINGTAQNRTDLKKQLKRKKSLDDGSMFV